MTRNRKKAAGNRGVPKVPVPAKVTGIKPGRNATINDIARLASVSKKTVSRVINQSPLVQEATRARIQAVIDKFGYVPDPQARGLAFRKAFLIGLVYDNPNAQYIVNCMEGALDAVRNSEYEVVVHPCDRKKPDFITGVRRFVERQKLRGVILLPPVSENDELTRALTAADCSYVRITYTQLDDPSRMVISNDRLAVAEVANYLVSLGHKRIGYIAGPPGFRSAVERLAGFREALVARGIHFLPSSSSKADTPTSRASPAAKSCSRSIRGPPPFSPATTKWPRASIAWPIASGCRFPAISPSSASTTVRSLRACCPRSPPSACRFASWAAWPLTRSCIPKPRAARTPW